jgi:hypothetical protein
MQNDMENKIKQLGMSLTQAKQHLTSVQTEKDSMGTVLADRYKKEFAKHLEKYEDQ